MEKVLKLPGIVAQNVRKERERRGEYDETD